MDAHTAVEAPHARPAEEILSSVEVDAETGLSEDEAARRRRRGGPNRLALQQGTPWWRLLWDQIANAVVVLLLGAGVAGFVVGETIEAVAILVVLIVNAAVGFATEYQAARSMGALRRMLRSVAEVERGDRADEIDATDLVVGDIVTVEAGESVPADLRVLEAEDLRVEESALTGEPDPVAKDPAPVEQTTPVGDRTSMLYVGTTVTGGRGRGVVVATGTATEMGRVAELAASAEQRKAPLQEGLDQLSRRLAVLVVVGAGVLVALGVARGQPPTEVVETAIALAIAVVPEGLPAVATLTLAVGMRRMAAGNALVRRLPAVETLGSTTVVCSDKTGTLTRNEMEAAEVAVADGADERDLWISAVLCNDADIDVDGDPVGDPTEVALLHGAAGHGLDWRSLRERHPRTGEVPFSSDTKRMAVVGETTVHVKGAPEVLLGDDHPRLAEAAERMADRALRPLAVARRPAPGGHGTDDQLFEDLQILGVVGLQDPPRRTATDAISALHRAGIRTVMITGDQPDTAGAIADRMHLPQGRAAGDDGDGAPVVTGAELDEMSDDELAELIGDVEVFARVDPGHKLRIVEGLQAAGEVVAVTGDGVNDAPALSRADVGVAMGSGTDVARQACDILLLDDSFTTIETAVGEGRRIFTNIRRFGQFLFSWHVAEVAVTTSSLVVGFAPPLSGLMILWNNLVIDVLPSFALALEPSRDDVMDQPPRDPSQPVIGREIVRRILTQAGLVAAVGLGAYAAGGAWLGLGTAGAQTMTFVAMSAGQTLTVFNARRPSGSGFRGAGANPWLWAALAGTAALEAVALLVAPLREVLGLVLLPAAGWAVAAGLALVPLAVTQVWRMARGQPSAAGG